LPPIIVIPGIITLSIGQGQQSAIPIIGSIQSRRKGWA